jgi:Arc/MetJ family transcription regulator
VFEVPLWIAFQSRRPTALESQNPQLGFQPITSPIDDLLSAHVMQCCEKVSVSKNYVNLLSSLVAEDLHVKLMSTCYM